MCSKKMGFCRVNITPPMGLQLTGYFEKRPADGILDDVYANAIAFEEDGKRAVLICNDLLGIYNQAVTDLFIKRISEECGIDEDAVFVCNTHTHTAAGVNPFAEGIDGTYGKTVVAKLVDAAKMAFDDLTEVTEVLSKEAKTTDLTYSRRLLMKDGHYQTWGKFGDPDILRNASEFDETMRVMCFKRENAKQIVIVNFQIHPDCVGGTKVSADFPAVVRNLVEKNVDNTQCVYLNGAEGQMTPSNYFKKQRFCKSIEKARYIGRRIAFEALKLYEDMDPVEYSPFTFGKNIVTAPTKRDDSRLEEARRVLKLHAEGKDNEINPEWKAAGLTHEQCKGKALPFIGESNQLIRLNEADLNDVDFPITIINFAGISFVGIPGEPFSELGMVIRAANPYAVTNICCQTNGELGYYATAEEYDHDGYEPRNSRMKKGACEILEQGAIDKLKELYDATH